MAEGSDSGDGSASGADDDRGDVVERVAADAAFELLGNETRLGVVRALFAADGPLSFSALRAAVGVRDSGQFNYHLDKLRGSFVRETDDGYALTTAGTQVAGSVVAGRYTKAVAGDPVPVDADCPYCEGSLVGRFDTELVRIACEDCDRDVISLHVPPGALEGYPREEWPVVAERWTRRTFENYQRGFCGVCSGRVTPHLERDPPEEGGVFAVGAYYVCQRCGDDMFANVASTVVSHPAVVAFYHEHGVDVSETPIWSFDWAVQPTASVVAEDPLRVEVAIEEDGDRLVLTLDADAEVVDERRA